MLKQIICTNKYAKVVSLRKKKISIVIKYEIVFLNSTVTNPILKKYTIHAIFIFDYTLFKCLLFPKLLVFPKVKQKRKKTEYP